ncbi:MAG TPA: 16S rRNA (cytosine(1402)-N(4))-methyltransferase RsmH [Epulopiscium sp.]|nr:16S rRNA (cytosine(1402)-N(4))-methyltransferase RsmH [Candidatus Epulonipiscium sp.]
MKSDNTPNENKPDYKRRVRYKGTHPKKFHEKYKELQPELYPDAIAKVIEKGSTPAGMHLSICVNEILDFLEIKPGQTGLDATLGYGGHTLEMLKCLDGKGRLYAIDVDPIELPRTRERLENLGYGPDILNIQQLNFAQIDEVFTQSGPLDFVLADLGVSSMQIDNPDRGFSFKAHGPLDLRLNPEEGKSISDRLKEMTAEQIEWMLIENADEPYAKEIARAIFSNITRNIDISTTTQLREIIEETLGILPKITETDIKKSCQRCFQALRIDINDEFEVLDAFLAKLPDILGTGGRVAILTFHSGEDRRVKKSFKHLFNQGVYSDISPKPIRPSSEERNANGRARSAKLRWAIKA